MSVEPEESGRTTRLKLALETERRKRNLYGDTAKIQSKTVDAILESQIEMSQLLDHLVGTGR
jgi:predicted DNA-binding protein